MDIDKLEAGFKTDLLIAEHVLKIPNLDQWKINYRLDGTGHYSSDIAAAWEMEEELKRRGLDKVYGYYLWTEIIGFDKSYFDIAHISPLQRCKAALKAVMENA